MITQSELKERFHYNPDTGIFARKKTDRRTIKIGSIVSTKNTGGYIIANIKGKIYSAHRLAWLYIYGVMPDGDIDHINGFRDDNRIKNLRCVTRLENCKNSAKQKNNTSGVSGVCFNKRNGLWYASVYKNGKGVHIASSRDFFEAVCARKSAERRYNYHPNHGRK